MLNFKTYIFKIYRREDRNNETNLKEKKIRERTADILDGKKRIKRRTRNEI